MARLRLWLAAQVRARPVNADAVRDCGRRPKPDPHALMGALMDANPYASWDELWKLWNQWVEHDPDLRRAIHDLPEYKRR